MLDRPRLVASMAVAALVSVASAANAQANAIVGSWRGTSICADPAHFPACHDEQVIYDVRSRNGARDTVTVRADKVVNGRREFMGEFDFAFAADSSWVAELQVRGNQARIVLRVGGAHLTGTFTDVTAGFTIREITLDRIRD